MINVRNYGSIIEGFYFNENHTSEYDMWLVDRHAPTPLEKEVLESVPFMQGGYDFSSIFGGRVYENRQITYIFEVISTDYQDRKVMQTVIENWLMNSGYTELHDDHALGYYYIAKCRNVTVTDSGGGLSVSIEFAAYPFKVSESFEGDDIWDTFNFLLDVSQVTEFNINGSQNVKLYNVGGSVLNPIITASSEFEIVKGNQSFLVGPGEVKSSEFVLGIGENDLIIRGNGTIKFSFRKELL